MNRKNKACKTEDVKIILYNINKSIKAHSIKEKRQLDFDLATLCLFLSLLLQTMVVVFGKFAALSVDNFTILKVLTNHYYLFALICLGLQFLTWQIALRNFLLSFAYFFMSIIYVNVLLISYLVFNESISIGNIVGALIIISGVILLTRQNKHTEVEHD